MLMKERYISIGQRVPLPHCEFFLYAGDAALLLYGELV
jgi:hypothetical protein